MKHINSIASVNLKGRNFRHTLHPLTVIAGDNATGKTAITDAIQIALLGYLPPLGKKPGGTMDLAPSVSNQMEIEATFSDGGKIRRSFTRTRTGAGMESIGEAPEVPAAQLNFSEFLNAKPTERHAILSSLMGQIDYAELGDRVKAKMATLGLLETVEITIDPQAEKPMDAAINSLADQARSIKQTVDQNRKTLASMAMIEAPARVSAEQMTQAEAALQAANEAVGKATAVLDELNERLQRAPDEPLDLEPTPEEIEAAQAKLVEAVEALRDAKEKSGQRPELTALLHDQQTRYALQAPKAALAIGDHAPDVTLEATREARFATAEDLATASEKFAGVSAAAGAADQAAKSIATQLEHLQSGTCPCCGNEGAGLEAAMQKMLARQQAAATDAATATGDRKALADEIEALRELQLKLTATENQIAAWAAKAEATALASAIEATRAKLETMPDPDAATKQRDRAERELRTLETALGEWKAYRAANQATPTKEAAQEARQRLSDAIGARESVSTALGQLRQTNAAYDAWQASANSAVILQDETEQLEKAIKGISTLRSFLQEVQREAVAESMKPMIHTAGIFLKGLINGEMATEAHRVGIKREGDFLPLEVLSGMEMVAVSAACQAALATHSEIRILIVDELARMTPRNREQFTRNCQDAIKAGVIDQAILVDQTPPPAGDVYTILV